MEYLEIEVKGWIKDRLVDVLIGLVLVGQPLLTGRNAHIWLGGEIRKLNCGTGQGEWGN